MSDDKFCVNCKHCKSPGEGRDITYAKCTHSKSIVRNGEYFIAGVIQYSYCSTMRANSNKDCGLAALLFEQPEDPDKCLNDYKGQEERRTA